MKRKTCVTIKEMKLEMWKNATTTTINHVCMCECVSDVCKNVTLNNRGKDSRVSSEC